MNLADNLRAMGQLLIELADQADAVKTVEDATKAVRGWEATGAARSQRRWSESERVRLEDGFLLGKTDEQLAEELERTPAGVARQRTIWRDRVKLAMSGQKAVESILGEVTP